MSIKLNGARVFISAAASGIGLAMVKAFDEAGARILACDIDADAVSELQKSCPEVEAVVCDCADWNSVKTMFGQVKDRLGGLDVLINNVGIAGPTARVEDIEIEDWRRTIDVNITGHFYCTKLAVPMLKENHTAAIINLSSVAGRLGFPLRSPYSSSKWAVVGFSKTLAAELGPSNIRVNAILPGLVEGPRIDAVIQAKADAADIAFDEMRARLVAGVSMRTGVSAVDVANMALYLASDLGEKVSGQAISVDGDLQSIV